jgi:hypothetical protein
VECALKACIAKRTERHEFPEKKRVIESYSHNLVLLRDHAEVTQAFKESIVSRPGLNANWIIVTQWNEEARYQRRSQEDSDQMIKAVGERIDGILPWLKLRW